MAKAQHAKGSSRSAGSSRQRTAPKNAKANEPRDGVFRRHRRDLWSILLGVAGIFVLLAEVGALGPLGHGLNIALESLFGLARWFLPLVLIGLAVATISGRLEADRIRLGVGLTLALVSLSGLAYFVGSEPGFSASTSSLGGAGGWVGTAIGGGLKRLIGPVGTIVVLGALAVVAFIFLTGIGLKAAAMTVAAWFKKLSEWFKQRAERPVEDEPEEVPVPRRRRLDPVDEAATEYVTPEVESPIDEPPSDGHEEDVVLPAAAAKRTKKSPVVTSSSAWQLPSLDLLQRVKEQRLDKAAVDAAGEELIDALAAHGVATTLVGYTVGPTVTRFELELGAGVKVSSVTSLHRDIAYAMASPDVRILAPIPGRSAIGVEVPNRQRTLVALGDLLASEEAANAPHPLEVPIGRDISGTTVVVNLAEMPHVLISGATGAGKSSCINSLITSLVMRATPEDLRLILVDPKRVELGQYNDLPHLLSPVVVDPKKASGALAWAVKEMERRYDILAANHVRDLTSYQALIDSGEWRAAPTSAQQVAAAIEDGADVNLEIEEPAGPERLPFIVIVVDELNDLMMVAAREVEDSVVRIAQMARAVGIHLVLATQRPSVDVITGVIKANIPSRMAFAVSSLADSRVILDQAGAERLIGKGDMLLLTASSNIARRLQSPWVSEEEVRKVVTFWRAQGGTTETVVALDEVTVGPGNYVSPGSDDDDDAVLAQARELVISTQSGSTSMLQRKLRVGFARAGRIMDMLEQEGVVAAGEGSKARKVLITPEEWEHQKSS